MSQIVQINVVNLFLETEGKMAEEITVVMHT